MNMKILYALLGMLCLAGTVYAVTDITFSVTSPTSGEVINTSLYTASFKISSITFDSVNCSYQRDGGDAGTTDVVLNDTAITPSIIFTPAGGNHVVNFICSNETDTNNKSVVISLAPNFYITIAAPTSGQVVNVSSYATSFTILSGYYESANCSYALDGAAASSTAVVLNGTLTSVIPDITITPSSAAANHVLNFICSNVSETNNKTVVFASAANMWVTITAPTDNEHITGTPYVATFSTGSGYYKSANCSYFLDGAYQGTYANVNNQSSKSPSLTLNINTPHKDRDFEVLCTNSSQSQSSSVTFEQAYISAYSAAGIALLVVDIIGATGKFIIDNITLIGILVLVGFIGVKFVKYKHELSA